MLTRFYTELLNKCLQIRYKVTYFTSRVTCAKSTISVIDSPPLNGLILIGHPHSHIILYKPSVMVHYQHNTHSKRILTCVYRCVRRLICLVLFAVKIFLFVECDSFHTIIYTTHFKRYFTCSIQNKVVFVTSVFGERFMPAKLKLL